MAFHLQTRHLAQVPLTVLVGLDWTHNHQIRRLRQPQRASQMSGLASSLLLATRAQTLGLPIKAVGGWRQMAVVTLFGELSIQLVDALTELCHLFSQGCMLLSELLQLFVFCHASTLLLCSLFSKLSRTPEELLLTRNEIASMRTIRSDQPQSMNRGTVSHIGVTRGKMLILQR